LKPFDAKGEFNPVAEGSGLRRVAVRSAGVTILGQGTSFVVQLVSTMVLARLLTPSDFGVVTMVTTFSLVVQSFGLNGFTEFIMQYGELNHALTSNLFWMETGIGLLLSLVFAAAAPFLELFYHNPTVAQVTLGLSPAIFIGCLAWIHLGLLQRAMLFRTRVIIMLFAQVAQVTASIALAIAGWHFWALIGGTIVQTIVMSSGAWLACRWVPSLPGRVDATGAGLKFALSVYSRYAFNYATRNIDNLLVGWKYGAQTMGFYKKAYDMFVMAECQLIAPIGAVAVSSLSRVSQDRKQFHHYFLSAVSVLAFIGMGVGADIALIGGDTIRILLGPGWERAGQIFSLFGPGIGVMMLYSTQGWIHLSIGRPDRWFRWGLIEFACTASLFVFALHWGPSGIALAWTASYFLLMFPGFWYAGRPIGLTVGRVFSVIWKFLAVSALAGYATALIIRAVPALATPNALLIVALRMVSTTVIFAALYLIGVILIHQSLDPLKETIRLLSDLRPGSQAEQYPVHETTSSS